MFEPSCQAEACKSNCNLSSCCTRIHTCFLFVCIHNRKILQTDIGVVGEFPELVSHSALIYSRTVTECYRQCIESGILNAFWVHSLFGCPHPRFHRGVYARSEDAFKPPVVAPGRARSPRTLLCHASHSFWMNMINMQCTSCMSYMSYTCCHNTYCHNAYHTHITYHTSHASSTSHSCRTSHTFPTCMHTMTCHAIPLPSTIVRIALQYTAKHYIA